MGLNLTFHVVKDAVLIFVALSSARLLVCKQAGLESEQKKM